MRHRWSQLCGRGHRPRDAKSIVGVASLSQGYHRLLNIWSRFPGFQLSSPAAHSLCARIGRSEGNSVPRDSQRAVAEGRCQEGREEVVRGAIRVRQEPLLLPGAALLSSTPTLALATSHSARAPLCRSLSCDASLHSRVTDPSQSPRHQACTPRCCIHALTTHRAVEHFVHTSAPTALPHTKW